MNTSKLFPLLLTILSSISIGSCGPTIKTTGSWVNRENLPAQPIKTVFIIAFTDNIERRLTLENNLAEAAEKKGLRPLLASAPTRQITKEPTLAGTPT